MDFLRPTLLLFRSEKCYAFGKKFTEDLQKMKTAAVYARYSSDNQTEQSIEGQLRVCEEYAQRNGIVIVDTYIDRAMTGTNDNRPDFRRMIKDSAKKSWDFILVITFVISLSLEALSFSTSLTFHK